MEEKDKPTVEEMIEAYRQYSRRIDEICRETIIQRRISLNPEKRHSK